MQTQVVFGSIPMVSSTCADVSDSEFIDVAGINIRAIAELYAIKNELSTS